MKVLHLPAHDDGGVVGGVTRLQRLRFLLEHAAPAPARRTSFPPADRTVEPPSFAEMREAVEQRGRRHAARRRRSREACPLNASQLGLDLDADAQMLRVSPRTHLSVIGEEIL